MHSFIDPVQSPNKLLKYDNHRTTDRKPNQNVRLRNPDKDRYMTEDDRVYGNLKRTNASNLQDKVLDAACRTNDACAGK